MQEQTQTNNKREDKQGGKQGRRGKPSPHSEHPKSPGEPRDVITLALHETLVDQSWPAAVPTFCVVFLSVLESL